MHWQLAIVSRGKLQTSTLKFTVLAFISVAFYDLRLLASVVIA